MPRRSVALLITALGAAGLVALAVLFPLRPPYTSQARAAEPSRKAAAKPADKTFDEKIKPFLATYCNACHNAEKNAGGVALDVYLIEAHARKDRKVWESVHQKVAAGDMPPKKKSQPGKDEKAVFLNWIETSLTKVDCTAPKDPGRVTLRRLNRVEYNNTIRDLCGVDFKPAEDFPSDDVGYGFDNIGDVLSLQPILLEKYMAAADKILNTAIASLAGIRSEKQTQRTQQLQVTPRSAKIKEQNERGRDVFKIELKTDGAAFIEKFHFPADGEYYVRVRAWGKADGGEAPKVALRVDGKDVKVASVSAAQGKPETVEGKLRVENGERRIAAVLTNPSDTRGRVLGIDAIEVEGPIGGGSRPLPDSTKLILVTIPKADGEKVAAAEKILSGFARRAYRRPVKPDELQRLMRLYTLADGEGEPFEVAIKLPLKAVLVSPNFLFRVEDDPKDPDAGRLLNDFELASRLSYFLWSTMPDDELSHLAERGELRKPGVLEGQVRRMLKDPRSSALVENFAGQWLMLRNIRSLSPDRGHFRDWDEELRGAMIRETELFFEHVVRDDRSVLEFLDANYTFVNGRLARHYEIPGVRGPEFVKVTLPDNRRGGIVTQASVLTVTSNPTRTSPVKRGKWVYENILGLTAPPPAPDVPELPPVGQLKGTLRQQMEQHRANPNCAVCHAKLDPLGFGLENFDAIGKWRDTDNRQKIDASGVLPGGEKFSGPAELRKVLLGKADGFRHCLAEKLMTYALGRGLEYYDKCTLDEVVTKLTRGGDKFSVLVSSIVESDPFQKRRGKRSD
jgi:mono/diheme cytochrome c family protein